MLIGNGGPPGQENLIESLFKITLEDEDKKEEEKNKLLVQSPCSQPLALRVQPVLPPGSFPPMSFVPDVDKGKFIRVLVWMDQKKKKAVNSQPNTTQMQLVNVQNMNVYMYI